MAKPDPTNPEPVPTPHPIDDGAAEPRGWAWIDGVPRSLLIALPALALGAMVIWGIEKEAFQLDFQSLVSALRATPTGNCAAAVATTVLSYLALVGYDICGLRYARAHAPLKTILLASFSGLAIGNAVGLGAFSGGVVRYRLYTAAGFSPGQIARTILFISIAFGIGLATIIASSAAISDAVCGEVNQGTHTVPRAGTPEAPASSRRVRLAGAFQ